MIRTITLKKIVCENFKCFKHKEVEFSDRTIVKGKNGIGKSTLYSAMLWCLFDKDMNGNSATDIRPHDTDGKEIDYVDITVSCTFDVDGREITLTKQQSQKWTKKRGSGSKVFEGNVNTFSINDIPKAQKDYKAYIADNFCDEETFLSCTNAQSFFRLDTKKRRAKLLDLAGTLTDEDVIATDDEAFKTLADMLIDGTVDELMTRSKGTIKRLNDTLKTLPARIDEQVKSKVDIDVSELELSKKALKEQIAEIEAKGTDLSKQYEEYQKASDGILEIKFEMNDIERKEHEKLLNHRKSIESNISCLEQEIERLEKENQTDERYITASEGNCKTFESQRQHCADRWKEAKKREFDENSCVCAYCGQEYPQEKKNALRAEFESHRAKELSDLESEGNSLKRTIDTQAEERDKCKERIESRNRELFECRFSLERHQTLLAELPSEIDISDNAEYQQLTKQLAEKEVFLRKGNSAEETRNQLSAEKFDLQSQLEEINGQIAKAQRNVDIDERISELQQEQRDTAQKIADEERILDLLEQFNRAKMNMLTDKINGHFKMVKWKLFQEQINGGYTDVCYALVNGSNREKGLNDSDCLLADLDILETFQRMNDVSLPLFLDRAESINADRIPQTECQLIVLAVSDDKEMVVE